MKSIEEIIRYEPECSYVEFKSEEYFTSGFASFVKDMIAMANSSYEGDKYIIIGVAEKNGKKTMKGLSMPLEDPAHYDQVIHNNIEPEIPFLLQTVEVDGKLFGVFIIQDCSDKPYMMRKEAYKMNKGDWFIRKGTSTERPVRRDLDGIWEKRQNIFRFEGDVNVSPEIWSTRDGLIPVRRLIHWPSDQEAAKIQALLDEIDRGQHNPRIRNMAHPGGYYDGMEPDQLREHLGRIKKTFHDEDLYEKFEMQGTRMNFLLTNTGSMYIEDVSVLITIPAIPGLEIAPKQYYKEGALAAAALHFSRDTDQRLEYPSVIIKDGFFEIRQPLGSLRHGIPTKLFVTDLRVFPDHRLSGKALQARVTIYGKNLAKALERSLVLKFSA